MQNDPLKNIWITYYILFYVFMYLLLRRLCLVKEVIALRKIQDLERRVLFPEQKVFPDVCQLQP